MPWRRSRRLRRIAPALAVALLPLACAAPPPSPPPNPFLGAWTTGERNRIAFRDDTVVINPPNSPPTAFGKETCASTFRFGYGRKGREALLALASHQPDLRFKLGFLLVQSEYPVAELDCDEGGTTYVLLDDHDVIAIYRDRDVAGLERLSRL